MHRNHAGDRNTLFLSPGQFIRRMLPVGGHPNRIKALIDTFPDILRMDAQIFRSEPYILFHHRTDDLVIRILENHSGLLAYFPQFSLF